MDAMKALLALVALLLPASATPTEDEGQTLITVTIGVG